MNLRQIISSILGLVVVGATAAALVYVKNNQVLGTPAVRVVNQSLPRPDGTPITTNSVWLPDRVGTFVGRPAAVTDVEVATLPKDTTFGKKTYRDQDGFEMQVTVVLMGSDRTSIHKPEFCLQSQGWRNEQDELAQIPVQAPAPYALPIRRLMSRYHGKDKNGNAMEVTGNYVFWFVADGRLTAKHGERMWWITKDLLVDHVLKRWAYVSVFALSHPAGEEAAYARIKEFIPQLVPMFQTYPGPGTSGLLSQQ